MAVALKKEDRESMTGYAKSCLPAECCGLISGRIEGAVKTVERLYFLRNIDGSPEHFTIDPKEQLAAIRDMRARGLTPLGNFHSHPSTPARPSKEDIRLALDPSASYLILSLAGEVPVLKAFRVADGAAEEEEMIYY
jgi:proteasome lid subunit RPN8/RPN11